MLDLATFHERLADFSANAILAANDAMHHRSGGYSQGSLFDEPSEPPKAEVKPEAKVEEKAAPVVAKPVAAKTLTWDDYKRIHCGNLAAASYWFQRNHRPLA